MAVYFALDISEWTFIICADLPEVVMDTASSRPSSARDADRASYQAPDLRGRVALVAGATRGVGRGTALALGEAGATVYCTGRSSLANPDPRSRWNNSPLDYSPFSLCTDSGGV